MAYQKRNFVKEQLLTAADLNAMDAQIAANETAATEAKNAAENAFAPRGILTSSNDLNNVTTPGMYYWDNASIPKNSPFTCDCIMIVYQSGGIAVQLTIDSVGTTESAQRVCYYNTWTQWDYSGSGGLGSTGMSFVETLDAQDNLNQIRKTGIYSYFAGSVPQNAPFDDGTTAVLICVMSGNYLDGECPTLQIAVGNNVMIYRANHSTNNETWREWKNGGAEIEILQTSGSREDAVMSQNAVTNLVNKRVDAAINNVDAAYKNSVTAIELAAEATRVANGAEGKVETALYAKTILTSAHNINNIKEQGIYHWMGGDAPSGRPLEYETGKPSPRDAMMIVYNFDFQVVQIVYELITARTATRTTPTYEEAWSAWNYSVEIEHSTGDEQYSVMSQAAVTGQIERLDKRIDSITNPDEGDSGADYSNVIQTLSKCFTSGVFVGDDPDARKPVPGDGLKLITYPGTVMIEGYSKKFAKTTRGFNVKETEYHEVYLHRLYTDTGEIQELTREVIVHGDLLLSKADAAELPVRGGGWYDILIYKVTIPAGATQITEDMIEDYRANEKYCGFVRNKL